jgi:hypothetical protein
VPALPLGDAGPYVAAAYLVFLALILLYVAIMAGKLVRLGRELISLDEELQEREARAAAAGTATPAASGSREAVSR